MTPCSAHKTRGRRRKGDDIHSDGICLPKSLLSVIQPCFPEDGWTSACQWEAVNESLLLLCLHAWLLLHLFNCLYLSLWIFSILLFPSPPVFLCVGEGKWMCGAEMLVGAKPYQAPNIADAAGWGCYVAAALATTMSALGPAERPS